MQHQVSGVKLDVAMLKLDVAMLKLDVAMLTGRGNAINYYNKGIKILKHECFQGFFPGTLHSSGPASYANVVFYLFVLGKFSIGSFECYKF